MCGVVLADSWFVGGWLFWLGGGVDLCLVIYLF